MPAPLEELPLFVRAGSVIPLLPPDVDTLAKPGTDESTVGLSERRRQLELLAFPGERIRGAFNRRGKYTSRADGDRWTLKLKAPKRTRFELQAALSAIPGEFEPCSLSLNDKRLSKLAWSFDDASGGLEATFERRRAKLVVSAC